MRLICEGGYIVTPKQTIEKKKLHLLCISIQNIQVRSADRLVCDAKIAWSPLQMPCLSIQGSSVGGHLLPGPPININAFLLVLVCGLLLLLLFLLLLFFFFLLFFIPKHQISTAETEKAFKQLSWHTYAHMHTELHSQVCILNGQLSFKQCCVLLGN